MAGVGSLSARHNAVTAFASARQPRRALRMACRAEAGVPRVPTLVGQDVLIKAMRQIGSGKVPSIDPNSDSRKKIPVLVAVEEPVLKAAFEASAKECNDHEQAVRVEGIMRCVDEVVPPGRYNVRDIREVVPLMAGGEKVAQLLGL